MKYCFNLCWSINFNGDNASKKKLCTMDQWCGSLQAPPGKKSLQELAFPHRSSDSNQKVAFPYAWRTG